MERSITVRILRHTLTKSTHNSNRIKYIAIFTPVKQVSQLCQGVVGLLGGAGVLEGKANEVCESIPKLQFTKSMVISTSRNWGCKRITTGWASWAGNFSVGEGTKEVVVWS